MPSEKDDTHQVAGPDGYHFISIISQSVGRRRQSEYEEVV